MSLFFYTEEPEMSRFFIPKIWSPLCNDIERQNLFSKVSEKISLVFYEEMKHKWGREDYE
jgi:hypothetical protein